MEEYEDRYRDGAAVEIQNLPRHTATEHGSILDSSLPSI